MRSTKAIVRDRHPGRIVLLILLVLLALMMACRGARPAEAPPDAVAFQPPGHFVEWWARTEACSGRQGQLDAVSWFVVPDASVFSKSGRPRVGSWSRGPAGGKIVVAGGFIDDEMVIRHEMLHALLDDEGHPPGLFVDRCQLTWQSWGREVPPGLRLPPRGGPPPSSIRR